MCDFKPGDEVTLAVRGVWASVTTKEEVSGPVFGAVYVVERVFIARDEPAITLVGVPLPWKGGYRASRFRKVERKSDGLSIESFLTIKPGFEEPKRAPARKAVDA